MSSRALRVGVLFTALACTAVACTAPDTRDDSREIHVKMSTDPSSLSLVGGSDGNSEKVARLITDSLVQLDARLEWVPRLAERWEVLDDGHRVVFHLRDDVRWHDGEAFTADDVVFTIEAVLDPVLQARSYAPQFEGVEVRALDARTVEAVYEHPNADFLEPWSIPIIPRHAAEADEDLRSGTFAARPIGCGPYRFVSYTPGSAIVLEANAEYWDTPPSNDRFVFRILPDERTSYQALLAGELDYLTVSPDFWREWRRDRDPRGVHGFLDPRLNVWYLAWNLTLDRFDDPRVRKAMIHALDRSTFASEILHGIAVPAATTYVPASKWAAPDVEPRPYAPDLARALLAEAGYEDTDGDGVVERDGAPLRFTMLIARSTQEIAGRIAAWVQSALSEVGVAMEIETLEFRAMLERRNAGAFDAVMGRFTLPATPDLYELYHSSARKGGLNFMGLADPEIDRLVEAGRRTFDASTRVEIYRELQRRLQEVEPLAALFHFTHPVLHRLDPASIEGSLAGILESYPGPRRWTPAPAREPESPGGGR